ncbi:unnamed protein product [Paramecium sonneborni]|uniref:Transmembrane protein n=1 Tax=Paramecium sonneborni TaxID=65129 RepID=A0A8S1RAF9_9CILI|nr:unnamed protein product [Paramecium sonneborni]
MQLLRKRVPSSYDQRTNRIQIQKILFLRVLTYFNSYCQENKYSTRNYQLQIVVQCFFIVQRSQDQYLYNLQFFRAKNIRKNKFNYCNLNFILLFLQGFVSFYDLDIKMPNYLLAIIADILKVTFQSFIYNH